MGAGEIARCVSRAARCEHSTAAPGHRRRSSAGDLLSGVAAFFLHHWPMPGGGRWRLAINLTILEMKMANTQTRQSQLHGNAPEDVQVVPSGKAVGAEIRGVDLSQPVPEASKELMRQAWADHGVLLWRDQKLPDISFLEAAAIFGVTKEPAARKYQVAGGYQIGGKIVPLHPHVSLISNLNEEGVPVMHNGSLGSAEVVWHSDNSYVEVPPAGSMLYAVVIPTNGGGDTFFSNQYLAYEELPAEL